MLKINLLMRRLLLLFLFVFTYLGIYGETIIDVCKIVYMSNPCDTFPCNSGRVFGVELSSGDTIFLTKNLHLICSDEELTVDANTYHVNDFVLLEGKLYIQECGIIMAQYPVIDILTIEKISRTNWDAQPFLGTYHITSNCTLGTTPPANIPFSESRTIVIEQDTVSDLLIHISNLGTVRAFLSNDSSFVIPHQILSLYALQVVKLFFGNGVIRNDSICIDYVRVEYNTVEPYSHLGTSACDNCKVGSSNIILTPTKQKQIYYDATKQEIVIDNILQNQSLTLELYDMLGKRIFRKTSVGNTVSIINLPNGIYVCRLFGGNQLIYSGKIVK